MSDTPRASLARRTARIKVMQALYAHLLTGSEPDEVFSQVLGEHAESLRKQPAASDDLKDYTFLHDSFYGTLDRIPEINNMLTEALQNWDLKRVTMTDRAILYQAVNELLHFEQIPVKVTFDEFLEIAKTYSTAQSSKFINGVLDNLFRSLNEQGAISKSGYGLLDSPAPPIEYPST